MSSPDSNPFEATPVSYDAEDDIGRGATFVASVLGIDVPIAEAKAGAKKRGLKAVTRNGKKKTGGGKGRGFRKSKTNGRY